MMNTILAVGIATIDYLFELEHFPCPDENMRAKNFWLEGGGNASNTIVALARLGCGAKILSRVGNDAFGRQCIDLFQKEGVDTSLLQMDETATPFSVILIDAARSTRTIVHYSKPKTIHYHFSEDHLEDVDYIYADGRNIHAYKALLLKAHERGIKIAIEADRKGLGVEDYFPYADVVFVSRRFHREYFASGSYEENLEKIIKVGPKIALTTLGEKGAILKTKECFLHQVADAITPVDTTGAGDAFNAAFLYSLLHEYDLKKALSFSTYYATESCKMAGARNGLLRYDELNV